MLKSELLAEKESLQKSINDINEKIKNMDEIDAIDKPKLKHFETEEELDMYIDNFRSQNAGTNCRELVVLKDNIFKIGHALV